VLLLGSTCLILVLAGSVPAVGWLLPLWLIGGLGNGGQNVLANVLVIRRAPAARRGRASASFGGVMNAATAIGYGAGGLLMALTGSPRAVMIGTGVVGAAICAILGAPLLRAAWRARSSASGAGEPAAFGRRPPVVGRR
jgi:MFS family permease